MDGAVPSESDHREASGADLLERGSSGAGVDQSDRQVDRRGQSETCRDDRIGGTARGQRGRARAEASRGDGPAEGPVMVEPSPSVIPWGATESLDERHGSDWADASMGGWRNEHDSARAAVVAAKLASGGHGSQPRRQGRAWRPDRDARGSQG